MGKGCIYILTNPSFPEYVKIGYATNLEERLQQLNRSAATPFAFRAYAIYEVNEALTDKKLHGLIDKLDPELRSVETFDGKRRKREFYKMTAEDAYGLLECIAMISGTLDRLHRVKPEGHELQDEKDASEVRDAARRGPLRFSELKIRPGEKLYFKRDPKKVVIVVDDRHVRYGDVVTSLSALAKDFLKRKHGVQGPLHFTYKGEVLSDLREKLGK